MTQAIGSRLADAQEQAIERLVEAGLYTSVSAFIRDAVREKLASTVVAAVRTVPRRQAVHEVLAYLDEHGSAWGHEIAEALSLDYDLVIDILSELRGLGEVR